MTTPLSALSASIALERNTLYVVLFHLPSFDPPKYHWALGLITSSGEAISYHAVDEAVRGRSPVQSWTFERRSEGAWHEARSRHAAVKIAHFSGYESNLAALLATIPLVVSSEDWGREGQFGCRLWLRYAVRLLAARGLVRFRSIYTAVDLEAECNTIGTQYHQSLRPALRLWDVSWPLFVTVSDLVFV